MEKMAGGEREAKEPKATIMSEHREDTGSRSQVGSSR